MGLLAEENVMNLLNDYRRVLTSILFEGKLFEDVVNSDIPDGSAGAVKREVYRITKDVLWQLCMTGVDKKDLLVHVEFNYDKKTLRAIIFFRNRLYNRLFGNLIPDQQMRELARIVNALIDRIDAFDWAQFVLDLEDE
jgi:hypothetical protein